MRRSSIAAPLAAAFLALGCPERTPQTIELEKYRVDVQLVGAKGLDLGGVVVRFNDQDQRRTRPDGTLRVGYLGARQSTLEIEVVLPSDLQSRHPTIRRFTLQHDPAGLPEPIRFELPVRRKSKGGAAYVVVIETGCEGQGVRVDGADIGATNREGYLSRRLFRHAGQRLTVTVEGRGTCEALACDIPLTTKNTIINIEGRCPSKHSGPPPAGTVVRGDEPTRSAGDPPGVDAVARIRAAGQARRARGEADDPLRATVGNTSKRTLPDARRARRENHRNREESEMGTGQRKRGKENRRSEPALATRSASKPNDRARSSAAARTSPRSHGTRSSRKTGSEDDPRSVAPEPNRPGWGDADDIEAAAERDRDGPQRPRTPPPKSARNGRRSPNDATPVRTPGSRKVRVACRPAGLDLYVDGALTVSDCSADSTAWIRPGVRKLVLKNPPGTNRCPASRPLFAEIPRGGRASPEISVSTKCRRSCTETVRKALRAGRPSAEDLACLSDIGPEDEDFLDARLLRAHAHVMQKELADAERVLAALAETKRGRTDPEVHARLAEVLGRRKRLEEASREAETAWRYRMKFRGNRGRRETWTLNVLKLRAGFSEQLFYRDRSRAHFRRALENYRELERSATRAGRERLLQTAQASRARLESQEAQLLGE